MSSNLFSNIWDDEDELIQEPRDQLVDYCTQYENGFVDFFKKAAFVSFGSFFSQGDSFLESLIVNSETGTMFTQAEKQNFVISLRKYIKKSFTLAQIQEMFPNQNPGQAVKSENGDSRASSADDMSNFDPNSIQLATEDLCGDSLYWINPRTKYKTSIINGKFSAINLDLEIDSKEPTKRWRITPMAVIEECRNSTKLEASYPNYFNSFSLEIFKRIGDVFPYEIPNPVCYQISAIFCAQFRELDTYYQLYRKIYPETKLSDCQDIVELLKVKLKNKFKYRGVGLKEDSLWPYRPHEKKKFEGMKVISKEKKLSKLKRKPKDEVDATERQVLKKMRTSFNYGGIKPMLEKKMEELEIIREAKKAVKPLTGQEVEVVIAQDAANTSQQEQQQQAILTWPMANHQEVHHPTIGQFQVPSDQQTYIFQNYVPTEVVSPSNLRSTRRNSARQSASANRFAFPSTEYSAH